MTGDSGNTEYLGRAIASLRTAQGLKRMDLKARSGLSYPYIAEIENGGKKSPSLKALASIAGALGVTPAELQARAEELQSADRGAPAEPSESLWTTRPPSHSAGLSAPETAPPRMISSVPDGGEDIVACITERVLDALGPRLRELVAREVSYAVREEMLRHREGR